MRPSPLKKTSHEELHGLTEFAKGALVPEGFGFLDRFGNVDISRSPACFVTARMTYCFSIAALLEVPDVIRYAAHGVACLSDQFWDATFGGYLTSLDGRPSSQRKRAYDTCFVALAASAAATSGIPGADELTEKASEVLLSRFRSNEAGALFESWDREFAEPERLSSMCAPVRRSGGLTNTTGRTGRRCPTSIWIIPAMNSTPTE